jgi:hypothetical protein
MAIMKVPEATMHKYHSLILRKNEIRTTWQRAIIKPVPESPGMQTTADH